MRLLIVLFILISVVIAVIQYKSSVTFIAQMMGISWGALAGAFLAPFLYGLYWKRTTKPAVWCSFLFGVGIMLANMLLPLPQPLNSPIVCGAVAMIGGLILVPVISMLTPKPDADQTEEMFSCYEEKVTVPKKEALGD